MPLNRTNDEITAQLDRAFRVSESVVTKLPSHTYEQGVAAALDWVTGHSNDVPLDDDDYPEFVDV